MLCVSLAMQQMIKLLTLGIGTDSYQTQCVQRISEAVTEPGVWAPE